MESYVDCGCAARHGCVERRAGRGLKVYKYISIHLYNDWGKEFIYSKDFAEGDLF